LENNGSGAAAVAAVELVQSLENAITRLFPIVKRAIKAQSVVTFWRWAQLALD
jgi:hypothetical protein